MISVQEKVNLSFFFISAYEKVIDLLKPFGIVVNEIYQNESNYLSFYVRKSVAKIPNKKKNKNINLKNDDRYKLLIDCGLLDRKSTRLNSSH